MSNDHQIDDAKGRIKEAAGDLTDNDDLKNEGKVDRASGSIKDKVGDAADKVKDVVGLYLAPPRDDRRRTNSAPSKGVRAPIAQHSVRCLV